jgi:thioesterase domain-containing protein
MRLVARLRATRRIELPLRALFAHPTPRALARDLATAAAEKMAYEPLLQLRMGGPERPLFCIHPAAGSSTVFGKIAQHLQGNFPVYGMQAKAMSDGGEGHASIREMAECYVQAMRQVQPNGPYRLLGWSFGGVVLQAMTAELETQGQAVEIGILLDSVINGDNLDDADQIDLDKLLTDQAEALGISAEGSTQDALKAALLLAAKREGLMPHSAEISDVDLMLTVMLRAPMLMFGWAGCPRLNAPIAFIQASDNQRTDLQDRLNTLTAGSVSVFKVAAAHNKMCDQEHSGAMAQLVDSILRMQ